MSQKILILIALCIAFTSGLFFERNRILSVDTGIIAERSGTGNSLINPLLECEVQTYGSIQKYIPFESDIKKQIEEKIIQKNSDITVSLYFRNLRNGPWFGINEAAYFAPASLMKLPVSIAYIKWAEEDPQIWKSVLSGKKEEGSIQNISPEKHIEEGKPYSVEELIQYSLLYSDNAANQTLLYYIPKEILYRIFRELSIPVAEKIEQGTSEYISVKEYASFFRILYNASYLSRSGSEYLLKIMSQTSIDRGIRKSIPKNILVSHKFGERRLVNEDQKSYTSQFHDCGIVYYDKYPYLICIMTKGGDDIPRLESLTEEMSSIVFSEIQKRYQ